MQKVTQFLVGSVLALTVLGGAAFAADTPKTVIKVWTLNRHDADFTKERIAAYNASNTDGITVEYTIYTDNYDQAVDLAFATNETPDILLNGGTFFQKYVAKGYWEPYNKYMSAAMTKRFQDVVIDGINKVDGKIYYLPAYGTTPRLIYNKGIFEKAGVKSVPKTWDEVVAASKQITDKLKGQGIYGFAANLKSPASALSRSIDYMMERSGGPRAGFDFKRGEYDFAAYKPFLEGYRKIFGAGGSGFPGSLSLDIDPLRTQFAAGKIGMYISWTHAEPGVYANQFPTTENWDVAPLPTLTSTIYTQNVNLLNGYVLNAKGKNPALAWKVIENVFLSPTFIKEYHEAGLGSVTIPEVQAMVKQPDTLKKMPGLILGAKDKVWPFSPHERNSAAVVVEGRDSYNTYVQLMVGNEDFGPVLADLTKRYNEAYRKGIAAGKGVEVKFPAFDPADPTKINQ